MKKHGILILFSLCCFFKVSGQGIDLRLLQSINGPASGADGAWRGVSKSLYITSAAVPASMLITGLTRHDKELTVKAFEVGASIAIAEGITFGLKTATRRLRPDLAHPDLIYGKNGSEATTDYSFPSGHTSAAFALATSVSISFPKWYVIAPAYTYATAVGYSRLYLGVHYPSDVAVGALVGAGSSLLTWQLQKLLNKKYHYH